MIWCGHRLIQCIHVITKLTEKCFVKSGTIPEGSDLTNRSVQHVLYLDRSGIHSLLACEKT